MLSNFYYYSLARPDHLRAGAYRLKIISATIPSLTRKALLLYYWSLLVLHQQPATVEGGYSVTHRNRVVMVY